LYWIADDKINEKVTGSLPSPGNLLLKIGPGTQATGIKIQKISSSFQNGETYEFLHVHTGPTDLFSEPIEKPNFLFREKQTVKVSHI
jgi:hypothetical protein